jgi:flagellar hook assembly protein FlgD
MSLPRAFLVALVLAALGAPSAAAHVRIVARDEPVGTHSARAAQRAPLRFDMVGLHWQGSGGISFRTRSPGGAWSAWQPARPEAEDLPDRGTPEAKAARGWKLGNPYWTGPAGAIQYRTGADIRRLRAYFIWSEPEPSGAELPARTFARASRPGIITRSEWGADESIVRAPPSYADRLRFAVVHHTAGTNSYSASDSAAIVRGIQRYHVLANGWNDIGYNFLVDKYGQVFEGRGGGMNRNVVGAHAQGFNTGSTGVAVLGTYSSVRISKAARSALVRLLAWRLDVAHVDPLSHLKWVSGGNPEYPAGTVVRLRAVSGHRDTGPTTCPGDALYGQLPGIAKRVAARGLPKLYDPELTGELGGPVRITGRLSTALPWTVKIKDADGTVVAQGSGSGTAVDWTWEASSTPFGIFTYTIAAGPDVRPWTARVPGPPPLVVKHLGASPEALTPNGDGVGEKTRIAFSLTTAATVTADVLDSSGALVRRLASSRSLPAGRSMLGWAGHDRDGVLVPNGRYSVRVSATSPGQSVSRSTAIVVDRTLGYLAASPRAFSPNGDGRLDATSASFVLTRRADVRVRVLKRGARVASLATATLAAGTHSFGWDGRDRDGVRVADGAYRIRVAATTDLGTRVLRERVRVDTKAPGIRIVSAVARRRTRVTVWLSEAALLRLWFGTVTWRDGEVISRNAPAGTSTYYRRTIYGGVRARARDAAANRSRAVKARIERG